MVAAAILGGAAITGVAGIAGSALASGAQARAAHNALSLQQSMFDQSKAGLQPYNTMGQADFTAYQALMGLGPKGAAGMQSQLESMPGYQFELGQGLQSTQNSYAARGLGTSGAALKGAAQYATGLANSNYGTFANNLFGGAQLGETAAGNVAAAAGAFATPIGNSATNIGNAQAGGFMGAANSIGNAANSIGQYYLLNSLLNPAGSTAAASGSGLMGSPHQ